MRKITQNPKVERNNIKKHQKNIENKKEQND
jgi:hypothetical protein